MSKEHTRVDPQTFLVETIPHYVFLLRRKSATLNFLIGSNCPEFYNEFLDSYFSTYGLFSNLS